MIYVFIIFILIGAGFLFLVNYDAIIRAIAHNGKKGYLIASVFDGYCLRNIIIKAYNKDHAIEKIINIKYIKEIKALRYIPEAKLNEVLRVYALNGGIII